MNSIKSDCISFLITFLFSIVFHTSYSQVPDLSKGLSGLSDEDSTNISQLVEHGFQMKKGKVLAWFPKDSLSKRRMDEILDTLNIGIFAAEKFIGSPLSWQYRQKEEPYTFFFRIDSFVSHAHGGYVCIPFWRIKEGKAPWLHEAIHEMLNNKADDSIPIESMERKLACLVN